MQRKTRTQQILEQEHGYRFDGQGHLISSIPVETPAHLPPTAKAVAKRMHHLKTEGRDPRDRRYPWNVMHHGQSFVVSTPAERRAARMSLLAYLKTKGCHLFGDYVMVSQSLGRGQGYRCWLISADEMPSVRHRPGLNGKPLAVEDGMPIPAPKE